MEGTVAHTKIRCRLAKEDILIVSYGGLANFWGAEYPHSVVKCPYHCVGHCKIQEKQWNKKGITGRDALMKSFCYYNSAKDR